MWPASARKPAPDPGSWWTTWRAAAIPALVLIFDVVVVETSGDRGGRPLMPLGWTLMVVSAAALYWRQQHPVAVLAVTSVTGLLYYPLSFPDSPIALAFVIALYTVARDRERWLSIGAALFLAIAFPVLTSLNLDGYGRQRSVQTQVQTAVGVAAILLLAIILGEVARSRMRHVAQAEQRAALAEATRESEALRRAMEERLRIARDLHDVVAHQISLINVQANAALHTRSPDGAFEALEAIRTASKDALREVRAVLGVLRQADGADPVQPSPSLARLPELIGRTEAAGLPVRSHVDVPPTPLPTSVELAAYRIVQEALTNAVRHAAASTVEVDIRCRGGDVMVTVEDDGTKPVDPRAVRDGNGLLGMAERAAAVGGEVTAGPRPGGGFRVEARLPIRPPAETEQPADTPQPPQALQLTETRRSPTAANDGNGNR
ncbi:sensor histidine kinase [Couchioplanes azureus]|uniref:sensor histidine kinase n=1 Tax=Couchioplanes caeruleus TaxID=56438 RepID=UPI001670C632|nr:sensor histidine kinase [Couchioplanes caeruleus]